MVEPVTKPGPACLFWYDICCVGVHRVGVHHKGETPRVALDREIFVDEVPFSFVDLIHHSSIKSMTRKSSRRHQ